MDKAAYYLELAAEYAREADKVANLVHRERYLELAEAFVKLSKSHADAQRADPGREAS